MTLKLKGNFREINLDKNCNDNMRKDVFYKVFNVITNKTILFNFYDLAKSFISSQENPNQWKIVEEVM